MNTVCNWHFSPPFMVDGHVMVASPLDVFEDDYELWQSTLVGHYVGQKLSYLFFGKLTYVLKEEDTNIIRGIPQIYNDNRNIKQQMATG